MTIVHLAGLWSKLIAFRPIMLRCFSMEVTSIGSICAREAVHAVILMILNMYEWDKPPCVLHHFGHVRKIGLEAIEGIHRIGAIDIV